MTTLRTTAVRPVGIDLFAGAGGLSLGFEQAGFDVAAAIEIDPIHAAVHEFNFPQCATICRSVIDLTGDEIRTMSGIGTRNVDVVFGGAPCQGFSMIGKRALDDPRNTLVHHFVRLVVELDAKYFVFENVKGLTVGRHKQFLDELITSFRAHGYDVLEPYRVLNAADYGVPQSRHRLFLIGCRKGHVLPAYPQPGGCTTVEEAIGDLPDVDHVEALARSDVARIVPGEPSPYAAILRGSEIDPFDYSHPRIWDATVLTSSARTVHTDLSRQRFAQTDQGKTEPVSRFLKLNPDGVCNTLRAGTASDRGAFTSPRPIHPTHARVITVREAARLHSYPDWFRLHATKWHGFRQVGNSVPPLLGRAVAGALIQAMGIESVKPDVAIPLGDETLLYMDMASASSHFGVPTNTIAKRSRNLGLLENAKQGHRQEKQAPTQLGLGLFADDRGRVLRSS
ncbi:MAG: DNA cytosine methyltransferase [Xanthomonadaceae bacterium]|nr:DNA cytosine methyltransferase [Xanthomonadaceae bacterium]MDP2186831.1 DNA cytosine methyltransferase [Xanthomonadales bacterium]MDZ4114964.1 DNA cytosine methyltransferase [Xanthomonadaceae bacterium]MDZ4376909.1 DNA cytosine methyltransferase [Xanthomonadaceae bacterium]